MEDLAASLGLVLYTTSSKENVNVETVFQHLAQRYGRTRDREMEYSPPRCQVGGWRGVAQPQHQRNPLQLHQQQQRIRLQTQIRKQSQRIQGRTPTFSEQRDNKPRSVQRQESQKLINMQNYEKMFGADLLDDLDEMWEDPIYSESDHLNSFPVEHRYDFDLGPHHTEKHRIKQNPLHQHPLKLDMPYSLHHSDHEQFYSSKFSTPTHSLIHSHMGQSRMLLDSRITISGREEEEDFATQFLESPMFDSLKWKKGWGVRRKGKYNLYGSSGGLANKCTIM